MFADHATMSKCRLHRRSRIDVWSALTVLSPCVGVFPPPSYSSMQGDKVVRNHLDAATVVVKTQASATGRNNRTKNRSMERERVCVWEWRKKKKIQYRAFYYYCLFSFGSKFMVSYVCGGVPVCLHFSAGFNVGTMRTSLWTDLPEPISYSELLKILFLYL